MNKIPLEVGKGYVVDLPKEASVKVNRFSVHVGYPGRFRNVVLATEYDALLALARRLRKVVVKYMAEDTSDTVGHSETETYKEATGVYVDSAWLEE